MKRPAKSEPAASKRAKEVVEEEVCSDADVEVSPRVLEDAFDEVAKGRDGATPEPKRKPRRKGKLSPSASSPKSKSKAKKPGSKIWGSPKGKSKAKKPGSKAAVPESLQEKGTFAGRYRPAEGSGLRLDKFEALRLAFEEKLARHITKQRSKAEAR